MSSFTGSFTPLLLTFAAVVSGGFLTYSYLRSRPFVEDVGTSTVQLETNHEPANPQNHQRQNRNRADIPLEGEQPQNMDLREQENPADVPDQGALWDQDDRARIALEEFQAQNNNDQKVAAWKQKGTVGTKKAKSLARRDQRRAYFEYVRQRAEEERERIQLEEQMFGDLVAEEREERERRVQEAKKSLNEANQKRRQEEEEERAQKNKRRERITAELRENGVVRLYDDDDIDVADCISNAFVLENGNYAVSVSDSGLQIIINSLKESGKLEYEKIQELLSSAH